MKPWSEWTVSDRLHILSAARYQIASQSALFTSAISTLPRTPADTLASEVLPLLAALRFLEQKAEAILKPRRLGPAGLPLWLAGIRSEVHRVPFGTVLVIAPFNYPLLLPGVQAAQALAAGNTVVWKPGRSGKAVADRFTETLYACGLPRDALRVTDESIEAVGVELARGVDKVFFTGSAAVGRILLQRLAETLTPSVMELSGSDAAIVLPGADIDFVAKALAFGMRLNGSATCMAPRRVLLMGASKERRKALIDALLAVFARIDPVALPDATRSHLADLLSKAEAAGATVHGTASVSEQGPVLISNGTPEMEIAQADIFAPVLTLIEVSDEAGVLAAQQACPLGLTASIYGDEQQARRLAAKLVVGTVVINDMIVPTADPRVPFGGRRQSGFGTTRGAEGLLEMTAAKTLTTRRGTGTWRFEPTGEPHEVLFANLIRVLYTGTWQERLRAMRQFGREGRKLRNL